MNLLVLTTSYPGFDGDYSGIFVHRPLERLVARGKAKVTVLCPDDARTVPRLNLDGIEVHRFRYFSPKSWQVLASSTGGGGIPATLRSSWLARINLPFFLLSFILHIPCMARRADVVYAHWIPNGFLAALTKPLHRRPLMLTVHGSDWNLMWGKRWGERLLRWVLARVDAVTTVNRKVLQVIESLDTVPAIAEYTPLGIDTVRFRKLDSAEACRALHLDPNVRRILFVGNLTANKGVGDLLEAMSRLVDKVRPAQLAVVGEGPLSDDLKVQASSMGLESGVLFAGRQPVESVPLWMNASHVLVLPSYSEGSPCVIREAFACGLPVIASAVGGIPEMVSDGTNGYLVRPGDPDALAKRIAEVLDNPEHLSSLAEGALASFKQHGSSWDDHASQLEQISLKVCRRNFR